MGYITVSLNVKKKWRRFLIWHGIPVIESSNKYQHWNHTAIIIRFKFFDIGILISSDGIEMYYNFGKYKSQYWRKKR